MYSDLIQTTINKQKICNYTKNSLDSSLIEFNYLVKQNNHRSQKVELKEKRRIGDISHENPCSDILSIPAFYTTLEVL